MSSTTTNLGLTKTTAAETIGQTWAASNESGGNFDIIDTKMGAVGDTSLQAQIDALNSKLARTVSQATLNSKLTNVDINTVTVSGRVATVNIRAQVGTAITGGEVLFDTGDIKFGNSYALLFDVSESRYGNTGNSKVFGYFSVAGVSAFLTSAIPANTWIHFFATMVLA